MSAMDGIMQKLVIVWILLPIIRCSQPEECSRTGKKASLEFYYYYNRFSNQIIHIETTANLLSQSQVDDADIVYRLSGNKINGRTLGVLNVRCVKLKSNLTSCPSKLQSSYIIIERFIDEGCVMRFENREPSLESFFYELSPKPRFEFNLTCIINRIYDASKPYDENPYARTSLISIIFLSACAALTCVLCFGWFTCSYYRRFKQRRIKIQQKKALENSVQKFLSESPVIIFNSKIKTQHFTDDDPMCAICLESFHENDKLRKLTCSHYFHILCIDPWILAHHNCPLCNQNILNQSIPSISGRITITNDETTDAPVGS